MAEQNQKFIRIVNWDRFQHYKDRNPPWIKLHRELLTSRTWATSDDASRVLAIALMMLAAATGNKIPLDPTYIRRVAYLNQDPDLSGLLATEFIEIVDNSGCASTSLADASKPHINARPETETETEQKKKTPSRSDEREPSDSRHSKLRELIRKWQHGTDVPEQWDGRSGKALSDWLKANPNVSVDQAASCIKNRFQSDEPLGAPPWEWIPKLTKYWDGPLDKFKNTWRPDFRAGCEGLKAG